MKFKNILEKRVTRGSKMSLYSRDMDFKAMVDLKYYNKFCLLKWIQIDLQFIVDMLETVSSINDFKLKWNLNLMMPKLTNIFIAVHSE